MTVSAPNKFQILEDRIEQYVNRLTSNETEKQEILESAFREERLFYYIEHILLEKRNEQKLNFIKSILEAFKEHMSFFTPEKLSVHDLTDHVSFKLSLHVETKNLVQIEEGSEGSFLCKINTYSGPRKRAKTYISPRDLEALPFESVENGLEHEEFYVFSFSSKEELNGFFETQLVSLNIRLK